MKFLITFIVLSFIVWVVSSNSTEYRIGVSIKDVTSSPGSVALMGYADPTQTSAGIHLRLRARTFVVEHVPTKKIAVYVNLDLCMTMVLVKELVVEKLEKMGYQKYTRDNVMIAATHTHSGPGGFSQNLLYNIPSLGFEKVNTNTIVNSIVSSIVEADKKLADGKIKINSGLLFESNINRSPTAYKLNKKSDIEKYKDLGDTEKEMIVLRFEDANGQELGALSWFAVHCTSMNNTNHLISSDNKGYASYLFEKFKNPEDLPGKNTFVAAFAQTNEGDVSPNTNGPTCPNGESCDNAHSVCPDGYSTYCIARGAKGSNGDMFKSTQIIGNNQFQKALDLYNKATQEVSGPIDFRLKYVDMSNVKVKDEFSIEKGGSTCPGAMGFSFAAGTTDGPGAFPFLQNDTHGNPFWEYVASFLEEPTPEQKACHSPKPILLDIGPLNKPAPWIPHILPLQLMTLGKQLIIVAVPAEFTTMAGRRLKEVVKDVLIKHGKATNDTLITISGLTNGYSSYVATFEEYQHQRYEAASTLFGPLTAAAYRQEFHELAELLGTDKPVNSTLRPPNNLDKTFSLRPDIPLDAHPFGKDFGSIKTDAQSSYNVGETVSVEFWGAHPNRDSQTGSSYLEVQRKSGDNWETVLTDGDWDTKFKWERHLLIESIWKIEWAIDPKTPSGTYRIAINGAYEKFSGKIISFKGMTGEFQVNSSL